MSLVGINLDASKISRARILNGGVKMSSRAYGLAVLVILPVLATTGCATGGSSSIAQAPIRFTADGAATTATSVSPAAVEAGDYTTGVSTYYALAGSAVLPVNKAPALAEEATASGLESTPAQTATGVAASAEGVGTTVSATVAGVQAAAGSTVANVADATARVAVPVGSIAQGAVSPTLQSVVQPGASAAASAVTVSSAATASAASTALATRGSLLSGPASAPAPPPTAVVSALLTTASVQQQTMKTCILKPKC